MDNEVKVLIVDDDKLDVTAAKRVLAKSSHLAKFSSESANSLSDAIEHIGSKEYDIVLLDLGLPDSNGIETIRNVVEVNSNIPIVVLTGLDDEETGLLAIKNGAMDYIVKGPMLDSSLVRTVLYALERTKVARELHIAEERYRTIFENSAVAIMMADEQERIVSWNKFTEDLLGMDKEDLYMKPLESLYPEDEWEKIRTYDVKGSGMRHHLETKMVKKNEEIIDIDVSLSVLKDADGNVTGSIGIIRDITERKQAEEKVREAMTTKSQFISMVSHELRTPLAIMKEDLAIVLDGAAGKINADQRHFLETAEKNLSRLVRLINNVLDFQKLGAGKMEFAMEEYDINDAIRDVHETMVSSVEKKGVGFVLNLDDTLPKLRFDRDKIIQVLTNLVSNAMKFTDEGSITISSHIIGNVIKISVSDTGCGIKQEDLPKLFHKFEQLAGEGSRKTGGSGLGLAISKEIVEEHGGKIWAESVVDKGTTVDFLLPVKERRLKPRKEVFSFNY
ncbi:MAG: PAS domain S-box protein [Planctomycetes bacterium]|nr:PAS domain S-box protein [Planctomycetota bacterium]